MELDETSVQKSPTDILESELTHIPMAGNGKGDAVASRKARDAGRLLLSSRLICTNCPFRSADKNGVEAQSTVMIRSALMWLGDCFTFALFQSDVNPAESRELENRDSDGRKRKVDAGVARFWLCVSWFLCLRVCTGVARDCRDCFGCSRYLSRCCVCLQYFHS